MLLPILALICIIIVWLLVRELQGNNHWQTAYVIATVALVVVIGGFLNLADNRVVDKRPDNDARMQGQNTVSIGGHTVREEPKTTGSAP